MTDQDVDLIMSEELHSVLAEISELVDAAVDRAWMGGNLREVIAQIAVMACVRGFDRGKSVADKAQVSS